MAISKVKARGKIRYRVRYRTTGCSAEAPRSKTFDTKGEAQAFEDGMRSIRLGQAPPPPQLPTVQTLGSFGVEYLTRYARAELAASTLRSRRYLWNKYVVPELGDRQLIALVQQPDLLQDFKTSLLEAGLGAPTIHKTLSAVSAVLGKAVEWNRIPMNPMTRVKNPQPKRKRQIRPVSPEQVERLRAAMDKPADRLLVSLMAYAGLRPGEILALKRADVGRRSISVTKAVALGEEKAPKTGRNRVVPLLEPLAQEISRAAAGDLLFPRPDGGLWTDSSYRNWRRRVFQPAASEANLGDLQLTGQGRTQRSKYAGLNPYDLRHSFASLMLAEGRNPTEIAEMLGHSLKMLFETYAHVIADLRGEPQASAEHRIQIAQRKVVCVRNVSDGPPHPGRSPTAAGFSA